MNGLGWVRCRFPDESRELRQLGQYFQDLQSHRFSPYFLTTNEHQDHNGLKSVISKDVITAMIGESTFNIEKLTIHLSSKLVTTISLRLSKDGDMFPISGFPRSLVTEDLLVAKRRPTSADILVAAEQISSKSENRHWARKGKVLDTSSQIADSTPSSNLKLSSQNDFLAAINTALPETPNQETHGQRENLGHKPLKRFVRAFTEPADKSVSNMETGPDFWTESSEGSPFSRMFGRNNASPTTDSKETDAHNSRPYQNIRKGSRLSEPSRSTMTEARTADMAATTPTSRKPQSASEPRHRSTSFMRRNTDGYDEIASPTRKSEACPLLGGRKSVRELHSFSLQHPSSSSSSQPPIPQMLHSRSTVSVPNTPQLSNHDSTRKMAGRITTEGSETNVNRHHIRNNSLLSLQHSQSSQLSPPPLIPPLTRNRLISDQNLSCLDDPYLAQHIGQSSSQREVLVRKNVKDINDGETTKEVLQQSMGHADAQKDVFKTGQTELPFLSSGRVSRTDELVTIFLSMTEEEMIAKATEDSMRSYC